ncbi:hypothetical protein L2E82_09901 [Cichorium intybus]|uniref:Uncharacterized protein n=1 Tax=Cichorium intybus TaxID=13427 RepID=A0ACB9GAK2_CICIN|nr:hypothetical protein L2E82_09901 [Cichorium intybus]
MILHSISTICLNHHRRISLIKAEKYREAGSPRIGSRNPKFMNGKVTDTEENRYEVAGLTDYCKSVASGCAANASAIAASGNDVDVLFGGDYDASYVFGDTADCLFVAIFHER